MNIKNGTLMPYFLKIKELLEQFFGSGAPFSKDTEF